MNEPGKRPRRLLAFWVVGVLAVLLAIPVLLYFSYFGREEEQEGIDMREDVDAVIFTEDNEDDDDTSKNPDALGSGVQSGGE